MVKVALPDTSAHFDTPTVVYTLTNTVDSKMFNFNKFANSFDLKDDNSSLTCECTGSPFVDKDHNQMITGNLKLINSNNFLKNFQSTPKIELLIIKKLKKA